MPETIERQVTVTVTCSKKGCVCADEYTQATAAEARQAARRDGWRGRADTWRCPLHTCNDAAARLALIREMEQSLALCDQFGEGEDEASWRHERGVLLTPRQARMCVTALGGGAR